MQQEDDLRGLARVMDFMRAVSILFVGINVYVVSLITVYTSFEITFWYK